MLIQASLLICTLMSAPSPVWVTLGTHASKNTARDFTAAIRGSKNPGNRLHNYLTVLREEKDGQRFRTIVGPFFSKVGAFRFGVNLLNKNGRVRSFMLTRFDGSTVSLSMSRSQRKTIIPSLKPPFPQMGLVVYPLALGWPQALSRLGSRAAATVSQGFRDEIWLTAEKSVCSGPSCKTWYKGITPSPHQLAWFQAGQVIPLRTVRSLLDEKGKLINYTSVSPIGTDDNKLRYQAIRFLPGQAPYRDFFHLPRLFYLKLLRDKDGKWKAVDRRGVEHYQLSKYSQWRPVAKLFRRHNRSTFFH